MNRENLKGAELSRTHQTTDRPLRYCAFSADSSKVVVCGYSRTELLSAADGTVLQSWPQGTPSIARSLQFHSATGRLASADESGAVYIRDIETDLDAMISAGKNPRFYHRQVLYSPDGRWLATCSDEGLVELFRADDLEPEARWQKTLPRACRLLFSPENRYLMAGNDQKTMQTWRVVIGDPVPALDVILTKLVAFRPDGGQMATMDREHGAITLRLWQWPERRLLLELKSRHTVQQRCREELIYSPGGHSLALLTTSYIFFWDADTGDELPYVTGFGGVPSRGACAFSPDGARFIAGDSVGIVRIWNCGTGELTALLSGHSHEVSSVAVSPDGSRFTSCDTEGVVQIWDLPRCEGACEVRGHIAAISALTLEASGNLMATGDFDGHAYIWDLQNQSEQSCQALADNVVRELQFRPDQKQLAVMGGKNLKVFEAGQTVFSFSPDNLPGLGELTAMAFSRDSRRLAVGYTRSGLEVKLWDRLTGKCSTLTGLSGAKTILFGAESAQMLILSDCGRLESWNAIEGGKQKLIEPAQTDSPVQPGSVGTDPEGKWLAWLAADQLVFWNRESGKVNRRESKHNAGRAFIRVRPDGRQLAVWEGCGRISLWAPRLGQCVGRLGGSGSITALAYSCSGRDLAAGRPDGSVCLWTGPLPSLHRKMPHMQPMLPNGTALPVDMEPGMANDAVVQLEFALSDRLLVALSQSGQLRLWDCVDKTEQLLPENLPDIGINGFVVSGPWLAAVAGTRIFAVNLTDRATAVCLGEHEGRIRTLRMDSVPHTVVTADAREIRRWDLERRILLERRDFQEAAELYFSPDGQFMAASHLVTERVVTLWDTEQYLLLQEKSMPEPKALKRLSFAAGNRALQLIYAEAGREVWDLPANRILPLEPSIRMETRENSPWALGIEANLAVLRWRWRSGELVQRNSMPYYSSRQWQGKDSFSPDLTRAATYQRGEWQAELWDVAKQKSIAVMPHAAAIGCVRFSPDGRQVVTGDSDGVVKVWNAMTGELQKKIDSRGKGPWVEGGIKQAALSPDGQFLALGQQEGWLLLWPAQNEDNPVEFAGHLDTVAVLDFSLDGRYLLSGDFAGVYKLWDVAGARVITELCPETRKRGRVFSAKEWLPDSSHLVFADDFGRVRMVSTDDGRLAGEWDSNIWRPTGLCCRPGQPDCLALTGASGTIRVGQMNQTESVLINRATEGLTQTVFSCDGRYLAAGDAKGIVVVMDGETGQELSRLEAPSTVRHIAAFGLDDEGVTVVADSVKLSLSSLENPQEILVLEESGPMPQQYSISADGCWVAASFEQQRAMLWDVRSKEKWPLPDRGRIDRLEFSAGGQYLIVEYHNGRSLVWDTARRCVVELEIQDAHHADHLIFLGGGKKLIGRIQRRTSLWDAATGAKIRTLPGEVRQPEWVSPDGRYIFTVQRDVARVQGGGPGEHDGKGCLCGHRHPCSCFVEQ